MRVRNLRIERFRGVASLDWKVAHPLVCLVGRGDSAKSTILDAIEYALTTRWIGFTDADFYQCRTDQPLVIEVTIGELPTSVLPEGKFGFHLRGWSADGELHDEPEPGDEPVVTVRLSVDGSLEPVWELVTDRGTKNLSGRDRALLTVSRLGHDAERHLAWSQGTALTKATGDLDDATAALIDAHRQARDAVAAAPLGLLVTAATTTQAAATALGAYAKDRYRPGLDPTRLSTSGGALVLQDGAVPLRLAGLGTRRLVAIALQRQIVKEGAVVLVEELEQGLEPHRIRHLVSSLRRDFEPQVPPAGRTGQVIFTTHSPTAIVELPSCYLAVVRSNEAGVVTVRHASDDLQGPVRLAPEALLARRVLVCEGKTEIGFVRALRSVWPVRHDGVPIEHRGVAVVPGGGNSMVASAIAFLELGYETALLADADVVVAEMDRFVAAGGHLVQWADGLAIEERVFHDVPFDIVQDLVDLAITFRSEQSVVDRSRAQLGLRADAGTTVADWVARGKTEAEVRVALGNAANDGSWFKRIDAGEELGARVAPALARVPTSDLAVKVQALETWAYA